MRTETRQPMTPERRALLAEIMAALPGDEAMEVALHAEFGGELRAVIVALTREHRLPVPAPDELDGLAFDACAVMRTVARWWRPDRGALPWSYGRDRLVAMLRAHHGPRCEALPDADRLEGVAAAPAAAPDDPPAVAVLDRLVRDAGHPVLVLLRDALDRVVAERDHELVLRYAEQLAAGDAAPSHTVGALVGRRPDAVRQAFRRAKDRLRRLALDDPHYRGLLALPLLAGGEATGSACAA